MQIRLNGSMTQVDDELQTLGDLLKILGYEGQAIAVAVNQEFVPRGKYPSTSLQEGLDIEIVSPMAGG